MGIHSTGQKQAVLRTVLICVFEPPPQPPPPGDGVYGKEHRQSRHPVQPAGCRLCVERFLGQLTNIFFQLDSIGICIFFKQNHWIVI